MSSIIRSWGSVGQGLEGMRAWLDMAVVIGQVGHCFGGCAKDRGRVDPAHGQDQGKRYQLLFSIKLGEGHSQLADGRDVEPDAVEAIGDVNLVEVDRPKLRVGVANIIHKSFEAAAKLHGFDGGQLQGGIVDTIK